MAEILMTTLTQQKRTDHQWIGVEVERFLVNSQGQTIRYRSGIQDLLGRLVGERAWQTTYESDNQILGVSKMHQFISLEPGSQFEISYSPQKSVGDLGALQRKQDLELHEFLSKESWNFEWWGLHPFDSVDDVELLPSPRYGLMDSYFKEHGTRGREMMRLTAGLHINLDFQNLDEGMEILRTAYLVAPVAAALFAHSPYKNGLATKTLSERQMIWQETDPLRSGFLPVVLEPYSTLEDYMAHISQIPMMYAIDENGKSFDTQGASLVDLDSKLQPLNAIPAMRQMFFEARIKPCCVEFRTLDLPPENLWLTAVAWVVGLLYDSENRIKIQSEFENVQAAELKGLMVEGAQKGLKSSELHQRARMLTTWSERGLAKRALGEEKYLQPLDQMLFDRVTPADLWLQRDGGKLKRETSTRHRQ